MKYVVDIQACTIVSKPLAIPEGSNLGAFSTTGTAPVLFIPAAPHVRDRLIDIDQHGDIVD